MRPSKATAQMSTYNRNNQNQEWYCEHVYICSNSSIIGRKIRDECKRRKIDHEYHPFVTEYRRRESTRVEKSDNICKIEMIDTGLKVQQLTDWAITEYNVSIPLDPFDYASYMVWIQPKREVRATTVRTFCDSLISPDDSWVVHWRVDDDDDLCICSEKPT